MLYPLASLSQISLSPSLHDGLPSDLELELRAYGCKLIHQAGILLTQKHVAVAAAQILFQRFWYVSSMKHFGVADISMGALFLASKLQESPLRMRDLINVYDVLLQRAAHDGPGPFVYRPMLYFDKAFYDLKEALVVAEMQILKRLAFNVHVVLPYGTLINYLQVLGLIKHPNACSRAWGYLNDALQTPVYALYQIPTIVCAAILLTLRHLDISLPSDRWWDLFDASWDNIWSVCGYVMRLYRARPEEERSRVRGLVSKQSVRSWLDRGIVLWSRSFTPQAALIASSPTSPLNSLIRDALIEGRTTEDRYEKDGYAVKWSFVNGLELIFVVRILSATLLTAHVHQVAWQRIIQLTYVDQLLLALKTLFIKYYEPFIASLVASLHSTKSLTLEPTSWNLSKAFENWDSIFDNILQGLEDKNRKSRAKPLLPSAPNPSDLPDDDQSNEPSVDHDVPKDGQEIARNVETFKTRLRGRGGRQRGRGARQVSVPIDRKAGRDSQSNSDSETPLVKRKTKAKRIWGDSQPTELDMDKLDYSVDKPLQDRANLNDVQALVDQSSLGSRSHDGMYQVKDWEFTKDHGHDVLANVVKPLDKNTNSSSLITSLFSRLTGSQVLTEADLQPVLEGMKQHLMKKNVAKEIAEKVCEGVGESLVGKKIGGFETTTTAVRKALSMSITRILTPKTSTDLLLSIRTKLSPPLSSTQQRMPFSITFVGVNGVGKSTNLSKVCFWLIQNGLRVLIAACDTFRSGAVEQLRVHVRNLSMLDVNNGGAENNKGRVELYEKGYGKDAAGIAREAMAYARTNDFDVVLIDTAGRMQDNEPLMRALAKLVSTNNPDKIIFVGEALVGNEAVDQLTKFDRALRDYSSASGVVGKGRGIDGMLVTKWDTVDDKVGAALSMTYVTGQPIIFVGCGQTYTDLRQLKVDNVVQAILSD